LESLAEPGAICVSAAARDHIDNKLPLAFDDSGDQPLKNVEQPIRMYRVRMGKLAAQPVGHYPVEKASYRPARTAEGLFGRFDLWPCIPSGFLIGDDLLQAPMPYSVDAVTPMMLCTPKEACDGCDPCRYAEAAICPNSRSMRQEFPACRG
jgi:hypothetical protein